ncbi:MAG: ribonuclease H-like domain-containing protein [Clostridiales bacterium]|nr:ribonuclease H-like domain-containing protein [Clostridiales bacterium]
MIGNLREKLSILESRRAEPQAAVSAAPQAHIECKRFAETLPPGAAMGGRAPADPAVMTDGAISALFRVPAGGDYSPGRMLFLDTETTGLSGGAGTVAFLIGLGWFTQDGGFTLEQYFMQDYDREADMLERLCGRLERASILVTFNGKCFDAPLISSRSIINRIRPPLDRLTHLDLLHTSRRMYRRRLASCSLGCLEREVLGVVRDGDIPGSEIPDIFFSYLRDGDFTRLEQVLAHNRQDILSMALLMDALCRAWRDPGSLNEQWDLYSCGRIYEERGDPRAAQCYARADLPEARASLAAWHKRRGEWDMALALWQDIVHRGECGIYAYVELSKYYEHRAHDPETALAVSEKALSRLRALGFHDTIREEARALSARIARLRRRVGRPDR